MTAVKKKVLVADDSPAMIDTVINALSQQDYDIRSTDNGEACLELIESFQPQLVFIDLLLPKLHGIAILKKLKGDPQTKDIGTIISSERTMSQDYYAAMECGANYYLLKPADAQTIGSLASSFFAGTLQPRPFQEPSEMKPLPQEAYEPTLKTSTSYVRFWGTRGSIPVSGLDYYRYGGNTSCLEVRDKNHLIIIDAGTGIRPLSQEVLDSPINNIHLFLGHTHWDHIIGFPFFDPVYLPEYTIHIYAARGFSKSIEELFTGMLEHDFFPVRLEDMKANLVYHDLDDGVPVTFGGVRIHYCYASHPGPSLCFKIESNDRTIGYATDNEFLVGYHGHPATIDIDSPLLVPYQPLIDFFSDCDTLIHEAQYTPQEYQTKMCWGHSSISNASILVKHCGVKEWVVTHHDPVATDPSLLSRLQLHQQVIQDCDIDCRVFMAYDGLVLPLDR